MPPFEEAVLFNNLVALVKLKEEPSGELFSALHEIGTICKVNQLNKLSGRGSEGHPRRGCPDQGAGNRARRPRSRSPGWNRCANSRKSRWSPRRWSSSLNALLKIALSYGRPLPDDVMKMIDYIDNPARLSDLVALYVNLPAGRAADAPGDGRPPRAPEKGLHAPDQRGAAPADQGRGAGGGHQEGRQDPEGIPAPGADEADPGRARRGRLAHRRDERTAQEDRRAPGCPKRSGRSPTRS